MVLLNPKNNNISVRQKLGITYISLNGEFSNENAAKISVVLDNLLLENKKNIVIDFKKCTFIDSTGMGAILQGLKKMKKFQGSIKLSHLSEKIKELFEISQIID